jgi:hypothetical protein
MAVIAIVALGLWAWICYPANDEYLTMVLFGGVLFCGLPLTMLFAFFCFFLLITPGDPLPR